jgi:hypothetical protein
MNVSDKFVNVSDKFVNVSDKFVSVSIKFVNVSDVLCLCRTNVSVKLVNGLGCLLCFITTYRRRTAAEL